MHPLFPIGVATLAALPFVIGWKPGFLRTRSFRVFGFAVILAFLAVYAIRMAALFPDTPPMVYNVDSFIGRLLRLLGHLPPP